METLIGQLIAVAITIIFILFTIMKLKLDASMTLIIGAVLLGVLTGIPLVDLPSTITGGFGKMLGAIGLSIGFGIMLGQLMSNTGAAQTIADSIVRVFPAKYALYAIALAAFVLSIPVYFDVTFVILIPIGLALLPRINKSIAHLVGALSIGAGLAHMLVPPTPAPLAAGEIFHFDIGILIAIGIPLGLVAVLVSVWLYSQLLDRVILRWNPETDIASEPTVHVPDLALNPRTDIASESGVHTRDLQLNHRTDIASELGVRMRDLALKPKRPGLLVSFAPIAVPLLLILSTTVSGMIGETPVVLAFIGDKTIAMLLGALTAYIISLKYIGQSRSIAAVTESLGALGTVLLVTGAGGAFAAIIGSSGISESIASTVGGSDASPVVLVMIAFGTGVLLRVATGSGTVAALTSMPIIAAASAGSSVPVVLLAMACLAGSLAGSTVNDSGFWIVTKLAGFQVSGGIKTYTVPVAISAVVVFIVLLGWATVLQVMV